MSRRAARALQAEIRKGPEFSRADLLLFSMAEPVKEPVFGNKKVLGDFFGGLFSPEQRLAAAVTEAVLDHSAVPAAAQERTSDRHSKSGLTILFQSRIYLYDTLAGGAGST